jgi:hypothetical protein
MTGWKKPTTEEIEAMYGRVSNQQAVQHQQAVRAYPSSAPASVRTRISSIGRRRLPDRHSGRRARPQRAAVGIPQAARRARTATGLRRRGQRSGTSKLTHPRRQDGTRQRHKNLRPVRQERPQTRAATSTTIVVKTTRGGSASAQHAQRSRCIVRAQLVIYAPSDLGAQGRVCPGSISCRGQGLAQVEALALPLLSGPT